jgi:hypothetical protein
MIRVKRDFTIMRKDTGKVLLQVTDMPNIIDDLKGKLEAIEGNGLAKVSRSREAGFSFNYGKIKISSHCGVTLTCNQDIETVEEAKRLGAHIVDTTVFGEDQPMMHSFLEHYGDSK